MNQRDIFEDLSLAARRSLAAKNNASPIVGPGLQARVGGFNRVGASAQAAESDDTMADLKSQIGDALNHLDSVIDGLLAERKVDESNMKRWIYMVGIVLVILVLASIAMPFLNISAKSWPTTVLSGVSLAGLVYLLYSPVPRIMAIANDRANLRLIPTVYRVRMISATDVNELRALASELADSLRRVDQDAGTAPPA